MVNYELLMNILIAMTTLSGIFKILLGALKLEKDTTYGIGDVVAGMISIALMIWVVFLG